MYKRLSYLFLLLLFLIGCTEQKEELIFSSPFQDWTVESRLTKNSNVDWYIETQVFYTGDETITKVSLENTIPKPLDIKGQLLATVIENELSNHGLTLSKNRIIGSENLDKTKMLEKLKKAYININYKVGDLSKWTNIKIKLYSGK